MSVNPNNFPKYVYKQDGSSVFCPSKGFFDVLQNNNWYSDSPADFIKKTKAEEKAEHQCRECMKKDAQINKLKEQITGLKKEITAWEKRCYSRIEKYLHDKVFDIIARPEHYTEKYMRISVTQFKKYDRHMKGLETPGRWNKLPKKKEVKIEDTNGEN